MRRLAVLIVILFSCRDGDIDPTKLHGVPPGVVLRCSDFSDGAAACVGSDHKTYACVRDGALACTTDRFDCAESNVFTRTQHDTTVIYQPSTQ